MTDCPNGEVRDQLPDLLHDRLTPAARAVVEAHVRDCADCQEELAMLGAMRTTLRRAPRVDVAAIAAAIPPYRAPAHRSWSGWRVAAAVVALAAGGTSVAVMQRDAGPARDSVLVVEQPAPLVVDSPTAAAAVNAPSTGPVARELALGTAAVSELDDAELVALLEDLQSLEVLPSADVETSAIVPVSTGTE